MIAVLGDRETVLGFRMAGIRDCYETTPGNLKENLERVKGKRVIVINERLFREMENDKGRVYIPVPDKFGQIEVGEIKRMVREIIGSVQ
jgi:vacuolar-type H+-ATPase subunit F/Vma7